jgi:hypothetical protein
LLLLIKPIREQAAGLVGAQAVVDEHQPVLDLLPFPLIQRVFGAEAILQFQKRPTTVPIITVRNVCMAVGLCTVESDEEAL